MARLAEEHGAQVIIGRATRITYSEDPKRILSVTYAANGSIIELKATDIVIAAGPWTSNIYPRAKLLITVAKVLLSSQHKICPSIYYSRRSSLQQTPQPKS